jgi:hypothetical protein
MPVRRIPQVQSIAFAMVKNLRFKGGAVASNDSSGG